MPGGAYALVLRLPAPRRLTVGSVGTLELPAGPYLYAGGARTGLEARIARHAERGKPVVAHIDALSEIAEAAGHATYAGARVCDVALLAARGRGSVPVVGFGATGCECLTHLYAYPDRSAEDVLAEARTWRP